MAVMGVSARSKSPIKGIKLAKILQDSFVNMKYRKASFA